MALVSIEDIAPNIRLGIWRIEETVDELLACDARLSKVMPYLTAYHHRERLREKLAVYELVFILTGGTVMEIKHRQNGKPYLEGWNISISDTKGYAAVVVSKEKKVAVDIEYFSDRVSRIVRKFIRSDEYAATIEAQLINWSAKETTYKYFSEQNLQYFEMRLQVFQENCLGSVVVENLKMKGKTLCVHYRINDVFVLTYAYDESTHHLSVE